MNLHCTTAPFTTPPQPEDFVVLCQLILGVLAFYDGSVRQLAVLPVNSLSNMVERFVRWLKSLFEKSQSLLMKKLLSTLAHGDEAQLKTVIYGYENLSEVECRIPLGLLKKLHSPSSGQDLSVVEKHSLDRFTLLMLQVPWLNNPGEVLSELQPLLIAEQKKTLRIIGYVSPWNEITKQFSESEMAIIRRLSMIWIGKAVQSRTMGDE
jgi:hypothetical protein